MNTVVAKTFFLCVIAFAGIAPCYSEPLHSKVKQRDEFRLEAYGVAKISLVKQGKPDSTAEEKLAKRLADDLNNSGIEVSEKELNDIANAITKGGQGAMTLATMICMEICKLRVNNGNPPAKKTNATLPEEHIDDILRKCRTNKNVKLALTQILVPKLILLKEKSKKSNKSENKTINPVPDKGL